MSGTKPESEVSVVIVNLNTRELLRRCLDSIDSACEVIVVDNASSDGSPEMVENEYHHVRLVRNCSNVGFGPANNQGIAAASRPLILLLNSDAYAKEGAIGQLASVFRDAQVVAAGGKLLFPSGALQESCSNRLTLWAVFCEQTYLEKLFPKSSLLSPYWRTRKLREELEPVEVAQVMGACLMFRPVESFDERFFLYCEDTELCHRLSKHGRILYVPAAEFVHDLGSSTKNRWMAIARYNAGKELYFCLHHGKLASFICWELDRLGSLLRLGVWSIATMATLGLSKRFRAQVSCFWRVLTSPTDGPERPSRTPQ
jgi:GT2 family glycosyltransferase